MAEQAAADGRERQHACQSPIAFRDKVMAAMAEYFFDDFAPADPMKECRVRTMRDERIPICSIARTEFPDGDVFSRPYGMLEGGVGVHQ